MISVRISWNLNFARALLNPLRRPQGGIQQGESKALICMVFQTGQNIMIAEKIKITK
jgi:hypothetical protein